MQKLKKVEKDLTVSIIPLQVETPVFIAILSLFKKVTKIAIHALRDRTGLSKSIVKPK